jgi:hypothetical protein
MRTRRRASIQDLRLAIDCLPTRTKIAMLEGIRTNPIIVGAYSTREGICPMLAAHRAGGRTDLIAFARAWDRFASGGARRLKTRRATERELLILRSHLEASLLEDERPAHPLAAAISEHRILVAAQAAAPQRHDHPGDHDRPAERGHPDRDRPGDRHLPSDRRQPGDRRLPGDRHLPGDRDRSAELRDKPGWAWTRLFRRYDDYEQALARARDRDRAPDDERQPAAV